MTNGEWERAGGVAIVGALRQGEETQGPSPTFGFRLTSVGMTGWGRELTFVDFLDEWRMANGE